MLQTLRQGATGWAAKIFLSLLVLSFAIWGVAGISLSGLSGPAAAVVGEQDIPVETFRAAYTNELRRIGQQAQRPITPEQARMAGIGERVLGNLVNEAAIDARVAALGLAISDEEVAREITGDEMFRGPTGGFDRAAFQQILRQNNLSETAYIALQRGFTARRQLTDTLTANLVAPAALREAIHSYTSESRSISYLTLAPEAPSAVPAPSEAMLRAFFEERKASFGAPEYRKLGVIALDPQTQAAKKTIPEAELRVYYDANKTRYVTAERRSIEQITFPTPEEARAASDRIKAGGLFEQEMARRRISPQDAFLGNLTKADMFDPKIADAAFALAPNAVSEPVEGAYSTALLRVTGVEQQQIRTFDALREEIRKAVGEDGARAEVLALHDRIDEARLGGSTLDEIAKAQNVALRVIEAVDPTGAAPDGKPVADLPQADRLLRAGFEAEVGGQTDTITAGADSFVWFDVRGVTPAKERSFDEAKAAVETRWREEEARKRLNARADALFAELKGGRTLEQVAQAQSLEIEQAETTRTGGAPAISAAQANAVFAAPVEGFGLTGANDQGARLAFRVTAENMRPFDPAAADTTGQAGKIGESIGSDIVSSFVRKLRDELGTRFDANAIAQVVGGGQS